MALKSKRSAADTSRGGKKKTPSFTGKMRNAGGMATETTQKQHHAVAVETTEARLERKATVADVETFATESLGQMTREKRHRLLYGD